MARDGQGYPRRRRDMMMMIFNFKSNDLIFFSDVYISEFETKLTLQNSKKVKSKIQGAVTEGNKIIISFRQLPGLFRKAKYIV